MQTDSLSYISQPVYMCINKKTADLVVTLSSSVYNVTEGRQQPLTCEVVKESYTDVSISVEVVKVFLGSAFPDCQSLGVCKLKLTIKCYYVAACVITFMALCA